MSIEPLPMTQDSDGPSAGVVVLTLEQPGRPVVVLDYELLQRLDVTLNQLPVNAKGLVIKSASERVFIAGADLKTISEWSDPELDRYLAFGSSVFLKLATLPIPTAAAINGAALGGGLELAMHCDALIAAPSPTGKPYAVGLPEAGLGLCPGWGGTNLLPSWTSHPAEAIARTCSGTPFTFDEAVAANLFTKVVEPASLIEAAKQHVASAKTTHGGVPDLWGQLPAQRSATVKALDSIRHELPQTPAAIAVVDALDIGLTRSYLDALDTERKHLVRLRHTPQAREALTNFFAKTKK